MRKKIKINSLSDIRAFTAAATNLFDTIHVEDGYGAVANAKSILGLMALDCSKPLVVVCENPEAVATVCGALPYRN